ncbi:MAG: T9SS type A sorting domain-containing protein [Bacteroidia bacterium]|nr:T9SS type A sorting domain-containing protein [Bacteroidia bacterium]
MTFPHCPIEDENRNLYFIKGTQDVGYTNYHCKLLKLNVNGEILCEKVFYQNKNHMLQYLLQTGENSFLAFGRIESDTSVYTDFWIVQFDSLLNINWEKKYYTQNFDYTIRKALIDHNGNIIVTGDLNKTYGTFEENGIYLYKMLISADSLIVKYFTDWTAFHSWDIIEKINSSGYIVFAEYFNDSVTTGQIAEIDQNFNISLVTQISNIYFQPIIHTAAWFSDSTILLSGIETIFDPEQDDNLGLVLLDTMYNIIYDKMYGKTDTSDYPGIYHNFDFIDKDNIYYVGTSNYIYYQIPFQQEPSWIIINKLDSNLNIKWQKFYGGDVFYYVHDVLATQDGGCLVTGMNYDHLTQNNETSTFLLKLNENGELTSSQNVSIKQQDIILYPNPGRDRMTIRNGIVNRDVSFELFDIHGRMLIKHDKVGSGSVIKTSDFSQGIYFYRFMDRNRIVERGKWVKE